MTSTKCERCGAMVGWKTVRHRCRTGVSFSQQRSLQLLNSRQRNLRLDLRTLPFSVWGGEYE